MDPMSSTTFTLDGETVTTTAHPLTRLIDVLRDEFGRTGVKEGCGEGECGACSVLLDGKLANTCILSVGMVAGRTIETPEGISATPEGALISDGYAEAGAVQCGFCMTGMLVATEALLRENSSPTEHEIRTAISGNLCRCTGYALVVDGIERAAELRAAGATPNKPGPPLQSGRRTREQSR
jgi:carbon-monoxide dehydrogenase small subunit